MRISDWSSDVCSSDLRRPEWAEKRPIATIRPSPRRSRGEGDRRRGWSSIITHYGDHYGDSLLNPPNSRRPCAWPVFLALRSEEHTSELQSLMRISYAVF